jgi:hypothetical protein
MAVSAMPAMRATDIQGLTAWKSAMMAMRSGGASGGQAGVAAVHSRTVSRCHCSKTA